MGRLRYPPIGCAVHPAHSAEAGGAFLICCCAAACLVDYAISYRHDKRGEKFAKQVRMCLCVCTCREVPAAARRSRGYR